VNASQAGFVITVNQVGSDVELTYSGSFTGLVGNHNHPGTWPGNVFSGVSRDRFFARASSFNGYDGSWSGSGPFVAANRPDFFPGLPVSPGGPFNIGSTNVAPGSQTFWVDGTTDLTRQGRFYIDPTLLVTTGATKTYTASGSFKIVGSTLTSFGLTVPSTRTWDWTQSGQSFVAGNTVTITAVPEPSSLACVSGLVAGLSVLSRRRRQA